MADLITQYLLKLRQNIDLEGDVELAYMELSSFFNTSLHRIKNLGKFVYEFPEFDFWKGEQYFEHYCRANGLQAYKAMGSLAILESLIKSVSFVQAIYAVVERSAPVLNLLSELQKKVGPVISYQNNGQKIFITAIPHYAIMELSEIVIKQASSPKDVKIDLSRLVHTLLNISSNQQDIRLADRALSTSVTSSLLSHDIHYYKAKFFPRMARSVLNICRNTSRNTEHRVLDNFVGSGTTLLEASTLGIPGVGLDIDPLSVLIARSKLEVLSFESAFLQHEVEKVLDNLGSLRNSSQLRLFSTNTKKLNDEEIVFPDWLRKNRNMTPEIEQRLYSEIKELRNAIAQVDISVEDFFKVLLSDVISRRIKMRFLGTGVGRFALSFSKTSLCDLFTRSVQQYPKTAAAIEWLRDELHIKFASGNVVTADTRRIPDNIGWFDMLLTSPPYLPASSGRESYTKARAPSLIALDMYTHESVDDLADQTIGAMTNNIIEYEALTDQEYDLVDWLSGDGLRRIKAAPTAQYFLDMRKSFSEMYQALTPYSQAVVVSGKQSTFYEYSSRKVLYTVEIAEILAQEAENAGFKVKLLQDLQLKKTNRNARPRSLDDYYETLIFLEKRG